MLRVKCKSNSNFQALKIESEQDLQFLLNFFLPYAYCPTCTIKPVSVPSVSTQSDKNTSSGCVKSLIV